MKKHELRIRQCLEGTGWWLEHGSKHYIITNGRRKFTAAKSPGKCGTTRTCWYIKQHIRRIELET